MNSKRWLHVFIVGWLVVVGAIVRWVGLDEFAFSPDDVLILGIAQSPTLQELFENAAREAHPPLYYALLRVVAMFGSSEAYGRQTRGTLMIVTSHFGGAWRRSVALLLVAVFGLPAVSYSADPSAMLSEGRTALKAKD